MIIVKRNLVKPSFYNELINKSDGVALYNTKTGKAVRIYGNRAMRAKAMLLNQAPQALNKDDDLQTSLYALQFLIDLSLDEFQEMAKLEEEQLFDDFLYLTILPTEQCNFRCSYCYENFLRGKMPDAIQEQLCEFVEKKIHFEKGLMVNWFGGEPLEALDVIENLSKRLIDLCKAHKKVYYAGMTTNGYNLTLDIVKQLKKLHVTQYQITLDGLPHNHDQQRYLATGEGTANQIIQNLLDIKNGIKSKTIHFNLRTNFTKPMLSQIGQFSEFLEKNFLSDDRFGIFWQVVGDYGQLIDDSIREEFCSENDYSEVILKQAIRHRNSVFETAMRPAGSVCYALKRNAYVISSDGLIKKCTCDMETNANRFGSLSEGIDERKHEAWLRRKILPNSKCYTCKKRPICHFRACKKSHFCPPNLYFFDQMLSKLTDDKNFYTEI